MPLNNSYDEQAVVEAIASALETFYETLIEKMRSFGEEAFSRSKDKISKTIFVYTKEGKELLVYGKAGH